jgi:hypothetical protein
MSWDSGLGHRSLYDAIRMSIRHWVTLLTASEMGAYVVAFSSILNFCQASVVMVLLPSLR